ncbi:hypothetical protein Back2_07280 [Nocardioides baekrokdamisoli]|uniref:FAD/NAD(P)-binding domain-containing protein n=1 Tax=Nocardioides baekrokdamisoli TaxID=1804624 RepID=A0A3G9IS44_9ACTN|nr:FAD-dependent oxidoreductase [Nocardioides baekrokdamisoli]BBH16441.1 hypothetical protein Back2_07280 [Nocardioides baekrokdamisoli]
MEHTTATDVRDAETSVIVDLCVIGAGVCGVNALWVASQYLKPGARVALVDRRDEVGGMWIDTYDYVRLHQPHPFFTAGNEKWTIDKPPEHLADKAEVIGHLQHCVEEVRKRVTLVDVMGREAVAIEEIDSIVRVSCRNTAGDTLTVVADQVIDASGLDIETNPPLALSSTRVRSVSPDECDVRTGEIAADNAPVWIIGSGKTAIDTAHTLIAHFPGREVNIVAGTGTVFANRDLMYPKGLSRWWSGTRPNAILTGLADRFDGTNEAEVVDWFRSTYATQPIDGGKHFLLGILSEGESDRVRAGLSRVVMGHLTDIVDEGEDVTMLTRTGDRVAIEPGSWVINCTGYFKKHEQLQEAPYISASGRVLSVGTSAMFGFSSFGGYFLTHLLFLGKLSTAPLLQADGNEMIGRSKVAATMAAVTLAQYNLLVTFEHVPLHVFEDCGLDFDKWYPLPRRMVGQLKFLAGRKRRLAHYRKSLETLAERFDLPLRTLAQPDGVMR